MSSLKLYFSRGIQTDLALAPQLSCSCNASQLKQSNPVVGDSHSATLGLGSPSDDGGGISDASIFASEGAYTQCSWTSDMLKPSSSLQKARSTGISHGRPGDDFAIMRRVVSFPSNTASVKGVFPERKMRVVSMPEVGKDGDSTSHAARFDSTHAISEKSCILERKVSMSHMCTDSSDVPRTPSPPSSPDSIMIVGNDSTQVSASFLRRSYADDDGWITWANSPPRPIPALHGPLSLPYARCPSGAEGTLVEGDDLPQKIWGLGIEEAQVNSRSAHRIISPSNQFLPSTDHGCTRKHVSDPVLHFERPQKLGPETLQFHRDAVIDLSKPATFRSYLDASGNYLCTHSSTAFEISDSNTVWRNVFPSPRSAAAIDADRPGTCLSPRQAKSSVVHRVSQSSQTGYKSDREAYLNDSSNQSQLNRSAPSFIPGSARPNGRWKGAHIQTSGELDYGEADFSRSSKPSQTVRSQRDYPASPSTCSPAWSPVFLENPAGLEFLGQRAPIHTMIGSQYHSPKVFSPCLDNDEHSSQLLAMIQQVSNQDFDHGPKTYPGNLKESLILLSAGNNQTTRGVEELPDGHETHTLPRFLDHNRKFSNQPRSVPFTRLNQRRLSAVAEEDISVGRRGVQPFLQIDDHTSPSKQSGSVFVEGVISDVAEPAFECSSTRNSISSYAISDDMEANAVVKLPRKGVNISVMARSSNSQSHHDTMCSRNK